MGGQFLSTAKMYETYVSNGFDHERQVIIDFIQQHQIKNVIFLTGDVHFTENVEAYFGRISNYL